jgi:hypothetical protein
MDIWAALRREEAKFQKQTETARRQLERVRAAMKILSRNGVRSGKAIAKKKRVMSASARAKISKAAKQRWAKFRAAKAEH